MLRNYLLVFAGGGIRASARYWLSGAVYRFLSTDFPYGNLVVNITGSFAIGLLMTLMEERFLESADGGAMVTLEKVDVIRYSAGKSTAS
jgi:CrcB protein